MKWILLPAGSSVLHKEAQRYTQVIAMKIEDNPETKPVFITDTGDVFKLHPDAKYQIKIGRG